MSGLTCTVFVLLCGLCAHGYKYGAPPYICKNPIPDHRGAFPQMTPSPFILSADVLDNENGIIKIRIHSSTNSASDTFTGYLLRIKDIAPFLEKSIGTGTFSLEHTDGTVFQCQDEPTSAVTHDTAMKKRTLEIKWQAPPSFNGEIVFTSTIAVNFTHFWRNVESPPVVLNRKPLLLPRSPNQTDESLNTTLMEMHKDCGIKKNCLYTPEYCLSNNSCNALLTILPLNGKYEIEIFSKSATYVAMGVSSDYNMGADAVTDCVFEDSRVNAYRSWNVPKRKTNKRQFNYTGVDLVRGVYENGMIYCKIHLEPAFEIDGYEFDLNKNWYYVTLASGRELLVGKPGIAYHDGYRASPQGRYFLPAITADPDDEFFYENCGNNTVCHGVPGTCVRTKNCRFAVQVRAQDRKFIVSMLTHRSMYVAVGFTSDQQRGDDHIVECLNNNTDVQTWRSWNVPGVFDNLRMGQTGLELLSGKMLKDGGLQCSVAFDPSVIPSFKLDLEYFLILAGGSTLMDEKVGYHNLARSINDANIGLYTDSPQEVRQRLFYNDCGESRTCMGYPSDCIAKKSCDYAVSIAPDNVRDIYSFHIIGYKSPAYVAIGLSKDKLMGDDLVVECRSFENGTAKASLSYNEINSKTNKQIDKKPSFFMPTYGSYDGEKLECMALFEHPHFKLENKSFDLLTDEYFLMIAVGKNNPVTRSKERGLSYHNVLYTVSSEARTLRVFKVVKTPSRVPVYVHGILMIVSWIALNNLGSIVARYYKSLWKNDNSSVFGHWLEFHKYCMAAASVLTVIGVIVIYFYSGSLISSGPSSYHAFFGFATFAVAVFQPLIAVFRPPPGTTRKIVFNTFHGFVGNLGHIIAISAIFLAVDMPNANLPQFTYWILFAYVLHYTLIHLILMVVNDVHTHRGEKESVTNKAEQDGRSVAKGSQRSDEYLVNSSYRRFRSLIFKYHTGVTFVFVLLLVFCVLYR